MTTPAARGAEFLRRAIGTSPPRVAIVLGSGLSGLGNRLRAPIRIPYGEIPGFPESTVAGHAGCFLAGELEGIPVLLQSGRFHLYEGHSPETVILPVRTLAELGTGILLITNAAGSLRRNVRLPALMLIEDHLNLTFRAPLRGPQVEGEDRFPDMSSPYDEELREVARETALANRIPLGCGVYAAVLGPSYETPAEIRMLATLGADAVGMSTVPEAIAARARGIRVLGISTLSNFAAGISPSKLSHDEVLEAGAKIEKSLETLVRGLLRRLPG